MIPKTASVFGSCAWRCHGVRSSRLPSRFPVGTKFVIEGRRGGEGQVQVFSRYLEFPDGTFFPLPTHPVQRKSGATPPLAQAAHPAGTD